MNTARGGLLDEEEVARASMKNLSGGTAVDVLASEPAFASPLLQAPNTIVGPHAAARTAEAIDRMGLWAAEEIVRVLAGQKPLHPVTLPKQEV